VGGVEREDREVRVGVESRREEEWVRWKEENDRKEEGCEKMWW